MIAPYSVIRESDCPLGKHAMKPDEYASGPLLNESVRALFYRSTSSVFDAAILPRSETAIGAAVSRRLESLSDAKELRVV
jgi:hypothetical protein